MDDWLLVVLLAWIVVGLIAAYGFGKVCKALHPPFTTYYKPERRHWRAFPRP